MSVLFVTPCYGGMITAPHFQSCLNLKEELTKQGVEHDWLLGWNESLVHRGRMEMVATFLKTKHTHLMFLDADIEFTPDDVAKIWNLQADIGVGVYAMKKREEQWFAAWHDGKLVKDLDRFDGPIEVDFAGTGFMMIRREVFDAVYSRMRANHERLRTLVMEMTVGKRLSDEDAKLIADAFEEKRADFEGANGRVRALFMTPIHNDGLESEDYHFCRLAREAGFKVMMDPSVRLGHWGQYRYGA